jgi:hypothetical protein
MSIMRVLVVELTMSGSEGMDSSTRVPVVECAWVLEVTSCLVGH